MKNIEKAQPLEEGLWTVSEGCYFLLGHQCESCGEVFFPRRKRDHCPHCFSRTLKKIHLGPEGKLVSFSMVMVAPAGGFYRGPVPYAYGCIDLPEGVRIKGLLEGEDLDVLDVGMMMTVNVEVLYVSSEGVPVETFVFKSSGGHPREKR